MFGIDYKVIVSDINYGGHMGNERALIIFQQCRMDWLNSLGFDEINIGENKGIIQLESHVYYLKEVKLGENLKCFVKNIDFSKTTFETFYEVLNEKDEIVLKGSTKHMAFDYERKRPSRLPKEFLEKLENINTEEN